MYIYYNRDQLILPMDLEIFIPKHHLCRIVDLAADRTTMESCPAPPACCDHRAWPRCLWLVVARPGGPGP